MLVFTSVGDRVLAGDQPALSQVCGIAQGGTSAYENKADRRRILRSIQSESVGAACQRCRLCSHVGREARLQNWDFKADFGKSPVPHRRIAKQVALPHLTTAIKAMRVG
jgi:hypothetical protein